MADVLIWTTLQTFNLLEYILNKHQHTSKPSDSSYGTYQFKNLKACIFKQAQMCSDPPKRIWSQTNHRPFTLTLHFYNHPNFIERSTVRLTNKQIWLHFISPCMVKLSKNSNWSACFYTHTPCSLIGQTVLFHTLPSLWLVSLFPSTPSLHSD